MTAGPTSIDDVLSIKTEYVIPRFQREYSWEDNELLALLEDVVANIAIGNNKKLDVGNYFIGSLVLVDNRQSSKQLLVVDGQQRLTTITILFSVLTQLFDEQKKEVLSDQVHEYVEFQNNDGAPVFRLRNESPKPFFQTRIQSKVDKRDQRDPETEEEVRLLNAYKYYQDVLSEKKLRKIFKKERNAEEIKYINDIGYVELLKALRDQLLALSVIQIIVPDKDTANIIFETLNAKGKDLEPIDLIKNKIFQTLDSESPIDKTKEDWKALRKKVYSRSELVKIGDFYRHFWISNYSGVPASKLYERFLKEIPQNRKAYTGFIDKLKKSADVYIKIAVPMLEDWPDLNDKEIYQALDLMHILNNKQSRSLILSLIENRGLISGAKFRKAFGILENMHFLVKLSKGNPSWIESLMAKYAKKIRVAKNKADTSKIIDDLGIDIGKKKPTYIQFKNGFEKLIFLDEVTRDKKLIQYIFRKFENSYRDTNELKMYKMSLDHIAPQVEKVENGGQIGNLLPLGQELNSKMGAKLFQEKKQILAESDYMVVKKFLEDNSTKEEWTAEDITNRTEKLARIAFDEIWKI
ncbi:hypothetical protein FC90_GL000685 [Latilactobacillus graminis DSM 20719]|uniref:DUF262 domain-containing protein n=2 Tax=Latilactobacillus graminis TaxID=60519 RepID=A0AA89L1A4_9LACO|nr:hypothetical protein FC90_GL000685 [Latilactobacillus graminis DSM 20719]